MEHDKDNGLDAEKLTVHCDFDHALLTFRHEALTTVKSLPILRRQTTKWPFCYVDKDKATGHDPLLTC